MIDRRRGEPGERRARLSALQSQNKPFKQFRLSRELLGIWELKRKSFRSSHKKVYDGWVDRSFSNGL